MIVSDFRQVCELPEMVVPRSVLALQRPKRFPSSVLAIEM